MTAPTPHSYGFRFDADPRDLPVRFALNASTLPIRTTHWKLAKLLKQIGPSCGGFSTGHYAKASPVINAVDSEWCLDLYREAQKIDGLPDGDGGTTMNAILKVARRWGLIEAWLYCRTLREMQRAIQHGPLLIGSIWTRSMNDPHETTHEIIVNGDSQGGHMYLLLNYDAERQRWEVPNTWGPKYGDNGTVYIRDKEMIKLIAARAEVTLATETKLPERPDPPKPKPRMSFLERLFSILFRR